MAKRKNSLAGTGLYQHQNGHYYWRRKDPRTGQRKPIDLGTRLDVAIKRAEELDIQFKAKLEGRPTADAWELELGPLVARWLGSMTFKNKRTTQNKRMTIERVVGLLGLRTVGDLRDVAGIDDRLRAFGRRETTSEQCLRRAYQEPLKHLAQWLAENNRVIDRNPLSNWAPIKFERIADSRRSLVPRDVAAALVALDYLGHVYGHEVKQRSLFVALLVTGARPGALTSRKVRDLDPRGQRIDLGASVGKKRRGVGALDPKTYEEVERGAAGRSPTDHLFPGPRGGSQDPSRCLDLWNQATSLAFVDDLWPTDAPRELDVLLRVSRSLLAGAIQVGQVGNPGIVTDDGRRKVGRLRELTEQFFGRLLDDWESRREGIVLASLRKSHHTWARLLGVPAPCIDKQLGHSSHSKESQELVGAVLGSRTGARHYLDLHSSLVNPRRSAQAVRDRLEEAEAEFLSCPRSVLADWARARTSRAEATAS